MKNICVIFNAGSYGTFVEWALNYFSGQLDSDDNLPFTSVGSAHNFCGNHLGNYEGALEYINSNINHRIVRFHPKGKEHQSVAELLTLVNDNFKKIIYLSPTYDSILWNMNNRKEKVSQDHHDAEEEKFYKPQLTNWGVSKVEDAQPWQLREFLSLFRYPQFISESELDQLDHFQQTFKKIKFVTIDSFKIDFKKTILDLLDYCELPMVNIDKIDFVHQQWVEKQVHINKDQLIKKIVTSALTNKFYDWSQHNLTLIDEAMIQYHLRENKVELKCYNLNRFPTNTDELKLVMSSI